MDVNGRIESEVGGWDGVTVRPHRRGGREFRFGGRVLGHVRPGAPGAAAVVDLPFARGIRDMLVETGRAEPQRSRPGSGWVSKPIRAGEEAAGDTAEAIELFRLSYERARVAAAVRAANGAGGA